VIAALVLAGPAGCAFKQKKVEEQLAKPAPIDCQTAPGDLRVLQQEKANVAERIAEGVTSIYPAGMVIGVLSGTETTKVKVAIGDYNKMIDQRIAEIQQTCGM
jgi:hypothetical protein